jgi:DNA-binding response OmpR family regulator
MDHLKTVSSGHDTVHCSIELDVALTIRILYVEDDETIAAATKEMLEEHGWQVDRCADADAALVKMSSDARYDFLLIDYRLPGFNGLELVRRARTLDHRARTPIGVISATPIEADAKDAGANVFLRKPQDIGSIANTIKRFLESANDESL